MPTVPRNTISEPVRTRLPQIRMAQPRTAEAMGAVTSALGRRAAAIGRNSSIIGEQIDATRRMGNEQMRILGAKAASEQAMWQGLGNLGNIMMNAGFKMDRIQERRDIEDARNAATEFTLALDPLVFGHVDPDTGERVAGALETPYSPGDAESDPNSPSIAVSKTMKELLDNPDAPWANLSPRARREFENDVARLRQGYMRQAIKADGDQIQIFRQVSQKRDYEAMMGHLTNLGAGTTPAETQNWLNEFNTSVTAYQRTYMGQYWNEDKQEWASPQIEKIVAQEREELLEVALSKRLETWLQLADVENDPERRENLLSYAETWAEMKNGEDAVLPELARAKAKSDAQNVRVRAEQRFHAENLREYQQTEGQYRDVLFGREQMTPELQQRMDRLPKEQRFKLEAESYDLISKIEEGRFAVAYDRWLAERNPDNNETGRQFLEQMILAMTSPTAKLKASAMLEKVDAAEETARNQAEVLLQNETAFKMERMIEMGGYIDASGAYVPMTDAQMASMILDPRITPEKAVALQEKARKKWKREDHEYAKQAVEYLQNEFGADALAEAFSIKGDQFIIEDGEFDFQTGETGWFGRRKTAELRADLVRDVVQAAVDYGRQVKTLDRTGRKPESMQTVIDGILRGPKGVMLNEAEIRDNLNRTRQLLDDMDLEYRRQAFEAYSRFPPQDFQQLAPATIED